MAGAAEEAGHRRGGRLDPSKDEAIAKATLEGLGACGYDRLSMDDIAARAGVGKAAIYRRWPSKAHVVAAAVMWWRERLGVPELPDTGTLRGDIEALLDALPDAGAIDPSAGLLLGVATAASRDAVLAEILDEQVLARPRETLIAVLSRAVARGEIPPGRDLSLLSDVALGLNTLRVITGKPIDRAFVRRIMEEIILPLATAPRSS
jgi:AcrR family transcriptional regulator